MKNKSFQEDVCSSDDDFVDSKTEPLTNLRGIVYKMDNVKKRAYVRIAISQDECHESLLLSSQYQPIDINHLYIPYEKIIANNNDVDLGSQVMILEYTGNRLKTCIEHAKEFANEQNAEITKYEVSPLTPSSCQSVNQLVAVTDIYTNFATVVGSAYCSSQAGAAFPWNWKPEDFEGLTLHSFLYGQLIYLPKFYIVELIDDVPELIFNHEPHPMETTTIGRPFIRKLRKLTSEEVMTIENQTRNLTGEITYELAAKYIRDVAFTCADLEEFISKKSIRELTCEVSQLELDFDPECGPFIYVLLTEDVKKCLEVQARDTWSLGSALVLSNTAFLGKHGLPVIIKDIDVERKNKRCIRLVQGAGSEDVLDAIKKHRKINKFSRMKFQLGPMDADSDKYSDAIRSGFRDLFYKRSDLFKAFIGRAAPWDMNNAAKLNQDFVEQVVIEGKSLDDSQRLAMRTALAEPGFTCVSAPPGSGKTFLIASLVAAGLYNDPMSRYAVCAATNVAVTNALDILHENCPEERMIRQFARKAEAELGKNATILDISLMRLTRDQSLVSMLMQCDPDFASAVQKRDIAQMRLNLVAPDVDAQLQLVEDYQKAETHVRATFIEAYGPTVYGATGSIMAADDRKGITHIIVDEADQMSPVEALALLCRLPNVKHITLVGDPLQLDPFTCTDKDSLAHKLMKVGELTRLDKFDSSTKRKLNSIYRCHRRIIDVLLKPIYGDLKSGNPTGYNLARNMNLPRARDGSPCVFVHVDGREVKQRNDAEADLAVMLLDKLAAKGLEPEEITVICHHHIQKNYLSQILQGKGNGKGVGYLDLPCHVSTVDSYQGKYTKVVLVLTTKTFDSNSFQDKLYYQYLGQTLSFISDPKRETVAVSRAQEAIYLFGQWTKLFEMPFWNKFFDPTDKIGSLVHEDWFRTKIGFISSKE